MGSPQRGLLLPRASPRAAGGWAVKLGCDPQLPPRTPCFCPGLCLCGEEVRSFAETETSLPISSQGYPPGSSPCPPFTSQSKSRSSTARSERAKHAFVHSLIILNSWVGATQTPWPRMAILTLKRKSYF